jgi:hypothetical protein
VWINDEVDVFVNVEVYENITRKSRLRGRISGCGTEGCTIDFRSTLLPTGK